MRMGQRNVRRTLLIQRKGTMCMKTIGLIGSFRKNFDEIVAIKQYFQDNNLHVNNPIGNNLTKQGCVCSLGVMEITKMMMIQ